MLPLPESYKTRLLFDPSQNDALVPLIRRLNGTTQVLPAAEASQRRITNRLTHTQIASIAVVGMGRILRLEPEDLVAVTQAIFLHDVGHPPYAHAGEECLNELMQRFGGNFVHGDRAVEVAGELNASPKVSAILRNKHRNPNSLSYLVHDLGDDIAWVMADLNDAITLKYLQSDDPELLSYSLIHEAIRFINTSKDLRIKEQNIDLDWSYISAALLSVLASKVHFEPINVEDHHSKTNEEGDFINGKMTMMPLAAEEFQSLKTLLYRKYYRSETVMVFWNDVRSAMDRLFTYFMESDEYIGWGLKQGFNTLDKAEKVCAYVAGMTESEFEQIYQRVFGGRLEIRSGLSAS